MIEEELLNNIDKIKEQLIARIKKGNFTQVDVAQIVGQLDFFEELQSLGYGDLLEDYFKEYENVILRLKDEAIRLGVTDVSGTSLASLDSFIDVKFGELLGQAEQYSKQLKSELLKHIIAGTPLNEVADNLGEIPLTNTQLRVAVNTGISEFERIGMAKIYEDTNVRFKLYGPKDVRTRASCDAVLAQQPKNGWTKEEIDNGAATEVVKKHAKGFAHSASELEQALKNPYTFVNCGGFNCRHRWKVTELDLTDEISLEDKPTNPELLRVENNIRDKKQEFGYVVGENGNIIAEYKGGKKSINIPFAELPKFRGNVFTHNHPSVNGDNASFSLQDIQTFKTTGLKEMRAVTNKYNFSFSNPNNDNLANLEQVYRQIKRKVREDLSKLYINKEITIGEYNDEFMHRIWENVSKQIGGKYARIEI